MAKVDLTNMRSIATTFMGHGLDLFDVKPEQIDIRDIAHNLAMQARFNGSLQQFYSVADHSIAVARMVPPEHRLQALLHDAPEYILGDLISPVKKYCSEYLELEEHLWAVIADKYHLPFKLSSEVKRADDIRLQAEARWGFNHIQPVNRPAWVDWSSEIDPNLKASNVMLSERKFLGAFSAYNEERLNG